MPYKKQPFSAKIDIDPKGAADELVGLYERSRANQKTVATKLKCGENTLNRWIKRLELAGTNVVRRLDRVKAKAAKDGVSTRPAQGWRRSEVKAAP